MNNLSTLVSSIEESRTMAITSLVKKMKAEGKDVISFSAGEPDFPTPQFVKDAAIKAINDNFTKYTPNEGYPDLLKTIVEKFQRDNNLNFETKNIFVSSGAKHSLFNSLMAICNPGDEVILQSPYWVSYPEMVKLTGAKPVIIDAGAEQNYKITPEQLQKAISPKTKAFLFNTPSNPTGSVYSKEEILALADVLKTHENIFVVSDEIYEKILFDGEEHFTIGSIDYLRDRTITINGVSKAYSMTGWRIGYAGGNDKIIKLARILQSQTTSHPSSISQVAACAALKGNGTEIEQMVNEFKTRRDFIHSELNKIKGIICPLPKGAFYVFFDVSHFYGKKAGGIEIKDSSSFCSFLLNEQNIGLVPGVAFGNDNCVRMSYACSLDELRKGAERITKALAQLL